MFRGDEGGYTPLTVTFKPVAEKQFAPKSKLGAPIWCVPSDLGWRIEGENLDYTRLGKVVSHKSAEGLSLSAPGMVQVMANHMNTPIVLEWFRIYLGQPVTLLYRKGNEFVAVSEIRADRPVAKAMGLPQAEQPVERVNNVVPLRYAA